MNYEFVCPNPDCGHKGSLTERMHCEGVDAEITYLSPAPEETEYGPGVGIGDVDDVTYHCPKCGQQLEDVDCEELYEWLKDHEMIQ